MKTYVSDVLVIGSGIAGLGAAIDLSSGYKVNLITKAELKSGSTWYAQGGIAAATSESDSSENHYNDTLVAGAGLVRKSAAMLLAENGPKAIARLSGLGIKFNHISGRVSLGLEGGHSVPRIHHVADGTGSAVEQALVDEAELLSKNLQIFEGVFGVDFIIDKNGFCKGVIGKQNSIVTAFIANYTIIASGGAGQIYTNTTNPETCTGDGISMAFRAGALISDMEFVQFHPTAVYGQNGPKSLISESVRGEGAHLVDCNGNRFMVNVHKLAELAPRDIVSRAIVKTLEDSDSDFIYLDATHLNPDFIKERFPKIYKNLKELGYDLCKDKIPVAPTAHYFIGGIVTNLFGRTSIPGLYACGEASCTGVHGANRLASNSLLEGIVFAGQIVRDIRRLPNRELPKAEHVRDIYSEFKEELKINMLLTKSEIKELSSKYLGVIRNREGLTHTFDDLFSVRLLKRSINNNEEINLMTISMLVAKNALERKESRGVHYREDFPFPIAAWEDQHIVFSGNSAKRYSWAEMDKVIDDNWDNAGL